MRIANLAGRAAVVDGSGAVDLERASGGKFSADLPSLYERWDEVVAWVRAGGLAGADAVPFADTDLGPPSPAPRQVFAIGVNYRAHAEESGLAVPSEPATFTKFPTCIAGPFDEVALPEGTVDWEVELVVVIGRAARHVPPDEAWAHVAGVTVGQDLSERTLQFAAGMQFSLGKSFERFGPTGPWLVTPDELATPDDLELGCSVDGEVVQRSRTSDLIFDVPALIARLSSVLTLLPGDVIFTGTPSGVGMARQPPTYLQPGQVVESWIEGVGTIRNRMVADGA